MNWLYYIPHDWEGKTTTTWEDIWLMPQIREVEAESYWLTVDSLGMDEIDEESLDSLGDEEYLIEDAEMLVNKKELSLVDILNYAKIWLESMGFSEIILVEGSNADFHDSNEEARGIAKAKEILNGLDGL